MPNTPRFVSERIDPESGAFDVSAMSRGEPGLPISFHWRGQRYQVARTIATRRQMGEDRGDTYIRRHYYDIETTDALRMTLYFERNPTDRSKPKAWWLYTVTLPDPIIETERLALRRWTYADREAFRRMVADPDVMLHLHDFEPMSDAEADAALAITIKRYERGYGDWAIVHPASGDILGESGLTPLDDGEVEIGWMLLPPFWGQGYASELASAVKRHAFETLRMPRLVAFVRPDNDRSSRVALKIGMRLVERFINYHGQEMLKYEIANPTPDSRTS